LGEKETGAKAALPMWMDFMRAAIAGKPDEKFPEGNVPRKQIQASTAAEGEVSTEAKDPPPDDPDPEPVQPPPVAPH